jgi:hypothetical protein
MARFPNLGKSDEDKVIETFCTDYNLRCPKLPKFLHRHESVGFVVFLFHIHNNYCAGEKLKINFENSIEEEYKKVLNQLAYEIGYV